MKFQNKLKLIQKISKKDVLPVRKKYQIFQGGKEGCIFDKENGQAIFATW